MNAKRIALILAPLAALCLALVPSRGQEEKDKPKAKADAPKHAYVVNTGDGSVSLVDLDGMKEVKRYKVGPRPYGIAVSPDGKTVAVGVEDEEKVKFFDAATFELKGEFVVGKMFNDHIVLTQDGKHVLVAN